MKKFVSKQSFSRLGAVRIPFASALGLAKTLRLSLLAAVTALPLLHSCNDSDVEGADSRALVTILNPGGIASGYYFKADNGQTFFPSQFAAATGGYNPEDGQRAFIYYSLLEEKNPKYDYSIKLYGITEILTKDVEEMDASNEEEFGDDPIAPVALNGGSGYDCLISAGYFTCSFNILGVGDEKHTISLVRSASADDTEDPSYTLLELRHKADDMGTDTPSTKTGIASFKLGAYDPAITQKKGLKIRFKDLNGHMQAALIDYQK